MRISHNKEKSYTRYQISGSELRNVSNYKDLGVVMASDEKWSKHLVHKANKVLGLLKNTIGGENKDIFSNWYKTLDRPILEYTCPVWSPHLAKDIHKMAKIQRRARAKRRWRMKRGVKYLNCFPWWSYKFVFNLNGLNFCNYFELCSNIRRDLTIHIGYKPNSKNWIVINIIFFVKIIKSWNDLPSNVINCCDSPNVKRFKLRLKNHMNIYWTDILYLYLLMIFIFY